MTASEDLNILASLPLLRNMPRTAQERIANVLSEVSEAIELADDAVLLHQGDLASDTAFMLLHGRVRIDREGVEPVMITAPDLLGEIQQFNPRAQRTASVRAAGPVKARRFAWQVFYEKARAALTPAEQALLMDEIEKGVCERLACETLIEVPIFRGLPDPLRVRASLTLHWLAQRVTVADGATLFEQDKFCGGTGFLLLHGAIELRLAGRLSQTLSAPSVLGVMPEFDPALRWTATATAQGDIELLKFSWLNYMTMLRQRLTQAQLDQLLKAISSTDERCFPH